jgi:hypothetical protein
MHFSLIALLLTMCAANGDDKAEQALDAARQLADEGKYEQALERHVWFHDHALEVDDSYGGVRLSFALSDWIDLGRKYPPALRKLKAIRDTKTAKLIAGVEERDLFHDVSSINEGLGESESTVALFKRIDAERPAFAGKVSALAIEALVAAQEYELARKYLPEPMEKFSRLKEMLHEGIEWAKSIEGAGDSRRDFEWLFASEILLIIRVLDATGDPATALRIQKQALDELFSPEIREALENRNTEQDGGC